MDRLMKHTKSFLALRFQFSLKRRSGFRRTSASLPRNFGVELREDHLEISGSEAVRSQYPYFWLRDHCRCALCYNSATHQRNLDLLHIPTVIHPKKIEVILDTLHLEWPDGHISKYSMSWLEQQTYFHYMKKAATAKRILWREPPLEIAHVPSQSFLQSSEGLADLMKSLITFGIGFVEGAEPTVEATAQVIERVGPPQRTLFGGVWEMKPSEYHEDTAYSTQALGAHTDNTYFTEAAGLQVFHILKHEGEGGATLLVDGFRAASDLRTRDEDSYDVLTSISIPSEYLEPDQHHTLAAPVLCLHPVTGHLQQIRFNLYDRACLNTVPPERMLAWYRSMSGLSRAVRDPASEYWVRLRPGQILFIDNWRVLHGRSAYTGLRWVAGAYISRTDYLSRARVAGALHSDI